MALISKKAWRAEAATKIKTVRMIQMGAVDLGDQVLAFGMAPGLQRDSDFTGNS